MERSLGSRRSAPPESVDANVATKFWRWLSYLERHGVVHIQHDTTLIAKACKIVCGGTQHSVVLLRTHLCQILSANGLYFLNRVCMLQSQAAVQFLISFADGNAVAQTSVLNRNILFHVGSVLKEKLLPAACPSGTHYPHRRPFLHQSAQTHSHCQRILPPLCPDGPFSSFQTPIYPSSDHSIGEGMCRSLCRLQARNVCTTNIVPSSYLHSYSQIFGTERSCCNFSCSIFRRAQFSQYPRAHQVYFHYGRKCPKTPPTYNTLEQALPPHYSSFKCTEQKDSFLFQRDQNASGFEYSCYVGCVHLESVL
jgi:hypothetical protein